MSGTKHTYHFDPKQMASRPRKLIIAVDDDLPDPVYGQFYRHGSSNVWRFLNAILRDASNQRTIFIPGRADGSTSGVHASHRKRCHEAFAQLVLNYRTGDTLYLFGGGSGGAVALEVAAMLETCGIPEEMSYLCDDQSRIINIEAPPCTDKGQKRNHRRVNPPVAMLGLWDVIGRHALPVSITGSLPVEECLTNIHKVPAVVDRTFHLVALDDHREFFAPHLLDFSDRVDEIWFPGLHEAVLGTGRERAIADIPLSYMIGVATEAGLVFHEETTSEISTNKGGVGVLSCEVQPTLLGDRKVRPVYVRNGDGRSNELPKVHCSVVNRMRSKPEYRPPNIVDLKQQFSTIGA